MTEPRLARGIERVVRGFEILAETALAVLLVLVAHEVFRRYVLNSPTQYSVELSEYLLVMLTFFSIGWVLRERRHVRVLFVVDRLSPRWRIVADLVSHLLLLTFCAVVVWYGAAMAVTALAGDSRSSSLIAFPMWIPYSFIPLGALVLGLQCLANLQRARCVLREGRDPPDEER